MEIDYEEVLKELQARDARTKRGDCTTGRRQKMR